MTTATVRIALHSRSAHWAAVTTIAACALAAVTGRRAIEIDLSTEFPPTKLVMVELCVILAATLLAIITRPRFWEWDRTATTLRSRAVAATAATAGILLPALCVPAVVPWLPDNATWTWVLANALVLSATIQLLSPLLTPLFAGTVTTVLWFGGGLVTNLAPDVWLPLATYRDPDGEWIAAAAIAAAAILFHARTCGITTWAHRQFAWQF